MGHKVEWSVPGSGMSVGSTLGSVSLGADTCPEREVILRVWRKPDHGAYDDGLDSYELPVESAVLLARRILDLADQVVVRQVVDS